ncbi:hypothetical protein ACKWTF_003737 [Chironomus riparius]
MKRNLLKLTKLLILSILALIIVILFLKSLSSTSFTKDLFPSIQKPQQHEHPRVGRFFGRNRNLENKKIDWHDYEAIKKEESRTGTGEHGKSETLDPKENELKDKLYRQNGFNALLSDKISLNRSVPDIRHTGCRDKLYLSELPSVSVIVPFYNEHWSTLLRTVYSVLNRSPSDLLAEIILVDDCSQKQFLKKTLDDYIEENLPKVKIIHLPERGGLITARLAGAKAAFGDVLIFLDSHTEANVNWLPPLLEPIAEDYKTCVCPFIDVIAFDTFEYRAQDEGARGAFDWKFFYKRFVMAGGLFGISSKFFWELGGYDPGLDIWGGEQYELSFKIWQCHGKMVDAPCSRVGHIYRGYAPFDNPRKGDFLTKNYKRVAEVWMDEYKEYLYEKNPKYKSVDPGDLTEQLKIRDKLKCKSFDWFMKEVAFDLMDKYPPVEPPNFASGAIQSLANPTFCVDTLSRGEKNKVGLYYCAMDKANPQATQNFALSWQRDIRIRHGEQCWDVSESGNSPVVLFGCHGMQGNQLFRYHLDTKMIQHVISNRCLDANVAKKEVFVSTCDNDNSNQKWMFGSVNETALNNWITSGSKLVS